MVLRQVFVLYTFHLLLPIATVLFVSFPLLINARTVSTLKEKKKKNALAHLRMKLLIAFALNFIRFKLPKLLILGLN